MVMQAMAKSPGGYVYELDIGLTRNVCMRLLISKNKNILSRRSQMPILFINLKIIHQDSFEKEPKFIPWHLSGILLIDIVFESP